MTDIMTTAKTQELLAVETASSAGDAALSSLPRMTTGGKTLPTLRLMQRERTIPEESSEPKNNVPPLSAQDKSKDKAKDKSKAKDKDKDEKLGQRASRVIGKGRIEKKKRSKSVAKDAKRSKDGREIKKAKDTKSAQGAEHKVTGKRAQKSAERGKGSQADRMFASLADRNVRKLVRRLKPSDTCSIDTLLKCADILYYKYDEAGRKRMIHYADTFKPTVPKPKPKAKANAKGMSKDEKTVDELLASPEILAQLGRLGELLKNSPVQARSKLESVAEPAEAVSEHDDEQESMSQEDGSQSAEGEEEPSSHESGGEMEELC